MTTTKVANYHDVSCLDDKHVYIGRAMPRFGLSASKWGNPFRMASERQRPEVIEQYRDYIMRRRDLLLAIPELRGKTLVCWCKPKACHGDVLAELAEFSDEELAELAKGVNTDR